LTEGKGKGKARRKTGGPDIQHRTKGRGRQKRKGKEETQKKVREQAEGDRYRKGSDTQGSFSGGRTGGDMKGKRWLKEKSRIVERE